LRISFFYSPLKKQFSRPESVGSGNRKPGIWSV
jgi:hypothetical protein